MKIRPDLRMPLLAAALVASASAWAAYSSTLIPAVTADSPPASAQAESDAAPAVAVKTELALEPNETVVAVEETARPAPDATTVAKPLPAPAPVAEATRADDAITITKPRLTEDQRIQAEVMERLAGNPRLTGKIGVESHDSVVHLSGYLSTSGQVWHAERDARSIRGVRAVVNEIRPKVGAVMS
jgi:hypothetical protein